MQEALGRYLSELLFQQDQLAIPGLGTFELRPEPALVDQVQGQVGPPRRKLSFNAQRVLDDGKLVEYIARQRNITTGQAQEWLDKVLRQIKDALNEQEMVTLPGVGRLYRDYEKQVRFLTDNTNFNLDAYGLQPVAAEVIGRVPEPAAPAPPKPTAPAPPSPGVAAGISDWFQRNLPWIAILSVVIVAVAIFFLFILPRFKPAPDPTASVPRERLNTSPSRDSETASPQEGREEEDELDAAEEAEAEGPPDTEAPTPAPDEHTAVIAVGLFSNKNYAERLVRRLAESGYNPVAEPEGGNTRVGILVRYSDEAGLRTELRNIQREWEDSAFVLSIDGVRQE